jgi:hypothetical protein
MGISAEDMNQFVRQQWHGEATASSDERRRCVPGATFLLEDRAGKGHDLRTLGNEALLMAVVRVGD